jgi:hypothetical protein
MKKIIILTTTIFFISIRPCMAQDSRCEGWKIQLADAEKKLTEFQKQKIPMEEFFSLMEEPVTTSGPVNEEIGLCQQAIQNLQQKIASGDRSPETAAWLQSYKDRVDLMKMRISKDFNSNTFYNQPKYLALQKKMNSMGNDETDMRRDTAELGTQLRTYNCPHAAKDEDPGGDISTELESWNGLWKCSDPKNPYLTLSLNGTGNSITGTLKFSGEGRDLTHQVKDCAENGNKLSCKFLAIYEDYEKFTDVTGSVQMTMTNNGLNTSWREISMNVRWKPGFQRDVQQRPMKNYDIPFKR